MKVWAEKRDVVIVTGSDAESYLQGQISQDLDQVQLRMSGWSFILQPQGKVDAWFRISRDGDRFLLDIDEGWGEALRDRLQRFLLRVDVQLELETWDMHAQRFVGEKTTNEQVMFELPDVAGVLMVDTPPGFWGMDMLAPKLPAEVDGPRIDGVVQLADAEESRIEAGTPAMGSEIDDSTIPNATGVVNGSVSFTKGCYTGQELVARVDSRGNNTPEQLRRLRGTGEKPDVGMTFTVGDDEAGRFTSVAGDDGNWVALGYVKRSAADAEDAMTGGGPARIERVGDFA